MYWLIPTIITVILGTIIFWPTDIASLDQSTYSGWIVGGIVEGIGFMARLLLLIPIMLSWIVYLALKLIIGF